MNAANPILARHAVGFGEVCPDCGAEAEGGMITHLDGCPVRIGLNRQALNDRAWFRRHPSAKWRVRKATWAERQIITWYVRETLRIEIDPYDSDSIGASGFWPDVLVRQNRSKTEHLRRFVGDLLVVHGSGGDQYPLPREVCLVDRFDSDGTGVTFTNHRAEVA